MTKIQLIKKLQKLDCPDDTEILIQERACENVHSMDDVDLGWYIDDGLLSPEVIRDSEDPEDYGLSEDEPKVIVVE